MGMLLIVLLIAVVLGIVAAMVTSGLKGTGREPRYNGEAPHRGPVMRFTGTSSEVKEDKGTQRTNRV